MIELDEERIAVAKQKLSAKDMIAEFCGSKARTNNISQGAKHFLKNHRPGDVYLLCAAVIIHDLFDPDLADDINRQRVSAGLQLMTEDLAQLQLRLLDQHWFSSSAASTVTQKT